MSSRAESKATKRQELATMQARQRAAERRRRLALAGAATGVVLAIVAGLVVAKLTSDGSGSGGGAQATTASAATLSALGGVPASTFDTVGVGTAQGGPKAIDAPDLTADGKPRILYVGAEYCPYCAAERWPVVVALSRFGSFSKLGLTRSSSDDVYPDTPTLSFHDSSYSSDLISFTGVETQDRDRKALDTLSDADSTIFDTYNKAPYVSGSAGGIPFVDIGGRFVSAGATYDPSMLAGKSQADIAAALKDPDSEVAKAIDGSANLFTAAICQATDQKPSEVCTSSGVKAAASALGKS